MTDQGRGYGSEHWGQGDPYGTGQYPAYPQQQAQQVPQAQQPGYPQQPQQPGYPQQPQQPQYPGYQQDPYGTGQYPAYPQQQPQPQQPQYPGYPQQGYPQQQPGYPQQGQGQGQQPGYPQQPPSAQPQRSMQPQPAVGADGIDWEAEAAKLEAGHDPVGPGYDEPEPLPDPPSEDVYDEDEDGYTPFLAPEDDSRKGRKKSIDGDRKQRKRSGVACLGMSVLLVAIMGGIGYGGYRLYEAKYGPAPDYSGQGTGSVQVTIPDGATGWTMANALKAAGVVKSAQAFVDAYNKDLAKAQTIQSGYYTMKLQMSAAAALQELIDAAGGEAVIIPEGLRASVIYATIDKKLGVAAGTTAKAAKANAAKLGLPAFAHDNPEGFLWPAKYSIAKGMAPVDLLKQMVAKANAEYSALGLDAGAQGIKLQTGYQVLIEASILQAEGNNSADFGKIARVLYNRINGTATQGKLQLDTTLQYALNSKTFTNAQKETDRAGGFNTYLVKGLPPAPISNPGEDAIKAVLNPTAGDWVYFVAVSPTDTRFDVTWQDFLKDVNDYCKAHGQTVNQTSGQCQ